ncbi:hypothetical protein BGZ70_010296 [Mortierella alpina]|uniref:Beta-lactamase-related domain-containing protein n=1 Tax=Mortierella alpina TaxID=64518 RepID=A0A9P6IZP0_MORAP|nr:hypothetical protein BGZ70_010296 [Mortierella alpina]
MKVATLIIFAQALQLIASSVVEGLPLDGQATKFANWRDTIEHARKLSGIPGMSVAVLHRGKVIFAEGFGKRNKENEPVTADTLMPIGSMTKAITAATIGEMVAEGKLDWFKTPVVKYVPEAEFDPVTTSELTLSDYLSHRTGLPHADIPWSNTTETRAQVFKRLKHLGIPTKLSSELQYSNIGYVIAGEAAANVAGIPYEDLARIKIFRPLGLTHTGFSPIEMGKRPNHAMPFYADSLKDAQEGKFHEGYLDTFVEFDSAAGDAYSNVYDLLKWGRTIMKFGEMDGKQVLNKDAVQEQLKAHTVVRTEKTIPELAPASNYGFGWFMDSYKGQAMYFHGGNTLGFSSMIALFPDSDLVITILSNSFVAMLPNFLHFYLADEILDLPRTQDWTGQVALEMSAYFFNKTAQAARGNFPPRQKDKPASHALNQYVGAYLHPLFAGEVTITLENTTNHLHFHFTTFDSKMEHYHFETFSFAFDMWSSKEAQLLTFITSEDGEVSGLQIEYEEKKWTFEKEKVASFSSFSKNTMSNQKQVLEVAIEQKEMGAQRIFGL